MSSKLLKARKKKKMQLFTRKMIFGFISEIRNLTLPLNVAQCCGVSIPSFSHWIFACKELENYRNISLPFLDDLFLKFAMIIEQKILECFFRFRKGL